MSRQRIAINLVLFIRESETAHLFSRILKDWAAAGGTGAINRAIYHTERERGGGGEEPTISWKLWGGRGGSKAAYSLTIKDEEEEQDDGWRKLGCCRTICENFTGVCKILNR